MYHNLEDIENAFETCYTKLYAQPRTTESAVISSFLTSLDLPSVGTEQNKIITQEITDDEIKKAISRLKGNKMPGADGYPPEWYKTLRETITPMLKDRFNYVLAGGKTPLSWRQAVISLIPKMAL